MCFNFRNFWFCLFAFFAPLTILSGQCEDSSNYWEESWVSCEVSPNPNSARAASHWLLFEFTEPQAIGTSHIWNANRIGESGRGAKEIFVDVSVDGTTWISLGTDAYTWAKGTEAIDYPGFVGPDFSDQGFVQKILFTIVSNHDNSNCVSIGEVKFNIDSLACYGILDECGVCDGPGLMTWYEDADGDGLGNADETTASCAQPDGYVNNPEDPCDNGLYGWAEMKSLFDENGCLGCHGEQGSGGLDLTSYEGISNGGNICGSTLLTGDKLVNIIAIDSYTTCSTSIPFPSMNERVGGALDATELAMIQEWVNVGAPYDCNCPVGSPDSDNDGVCDASDDCPNFNDNLIGTACDDGNPCTLNDKYIASCQCEGQVIADSDFDGVCDSLDLSPLNPCTADGIYGLPEPSDWLPSSFGDCDADGIANGDGDLDDFDPCIDDEGTSLSPDCFCPGEALQAGPAFLVSEGVWGTSAASAAGTPDGNLTGGIYSGDYVELTFPYVEIGQEICFELGFSEAETGVQFEVNGLGTYKFYNPDTSKTDFELQSFCFPTFVAGEQLIRITRLITGGIRVDGATYDYCPCTISDPKNDFTSCQCPDDFSSEMGTLESSAGFSNPDHANGFPDSVFTGGINNGATDSLEISFPSLPANTEICVVLAFNNTAGKAGFLLNNHYFEVVNPSGSTTNTDGQEICFLTTTTGPQILKIKEQGSGSIYVDGSFYRSCNGCVLDSDNDGVCDDVDICPGYDDFADIDNDFIPDGCDDCSTVGQACNDNDDCTINDVLDENCNCAGTFADADSDGVCDASDICPNGDDNIDTDDDGIPDICDPCSTVGQACNDNDDCTINDVLDENCNCAGTFADADSDGVCDASDICPNGDDNIDTDDDSIPDACDDCSTVGQACNDNDDCTINDIFDENCNCAGTFADADSDGVCDASDICPNGDDNIDTDDDGIPDACDDCSTVGQACNDNDDCTINDIFDENCNCAGTFADADSDGVCDASDICPNGDDNIDTDDDGIPDACDPCSTVGQTCNDNDDCTINDIFDENCNCAGTFADADSDGVCDALDICPNGDDNIDTDDDGIPDACDPCSTVGQTCIDNDDCTINDIFDENCNCVGTFADADSDGVCDALDICPNGDDNIDTDNDGIPDACDPCSTVGQACNDNDDCTINDVLDENCNCVGTFEDVDSDGVCDASDICPEGDDGIDVNNDAIPDACETCIPVLTSFKKDYLSHTGVGAVYTRLELGNQLDPSFSITELGADLSGSLANRYIDLVEITYTNSDGRLFNYGLFSGEDSDSLRVELFGNIASITLTLKDGYDGNSEGVGIRLSKVSTCEQIAKYEEEENDLAGPNSLDVYPNPSEGQFAVLFNTQERKDYRLIITDAFGKVRYVESFAGAGDHLKIAMDHGGWLSGIYFVSLEEGALRRTKKIVIAKY